MNQIQQFTILTPYLVLPYILQLQIFQKDPFILESNFSHLPTSVKNTSHDRNQVRSVLKSFFLINSFYLLEEYFTWNTNRELGSV